VQYSLPTHSCPVDIDANLKGCSNSIEQIILYGYTWVWPAR